MALMFFTASAEFVPKQSDMRSDGSNPCHSQFCFPSHPHRLVAMCSDPSALCRPPECSHFHVDFCASQFFDNATNYISFRPDFACLDTANFSSYVSLIIAIVHSSSFDHFSFEDLTLALDEQSVTNYGTSWMSWLACQLDTANCSLPARRCKWSIAYLLLWLSQFFSVVFHQCSDFQHSDNPMYVRPSPCQDVRFSGMPSSVLMFLFKPPEDVTCIAVVAGYCKDLPLSAFSVANHQPQVSDCQSIHPSCSHVQCSGDHLVHARTPKVAVSHWDHAHLDCHAHRSKRRFHHLLWIFFASSGLIHNVDSCIHHNFSPQDVSQFHCELLSIRYPVAPQHQSVRSFAVGSADLSHRPWRSILWTFPAAEVSTQDVHCLPGDHGLVDFHRCQAGAPVHAFWQPRSFRSSAQHVLAAISVFDKHPEAGIRATPADRNALPSAHGCPWNAVVLTSVNASEALRASTPLQATPVLGDGPNFPVIAAANAHQLVLPSLRDTSVTKQPDVPSSGGETDVVAFAAFTRSKPVPTSSLTNLPHVAQQELEEGGDPEDQVPSDSDDDLSTVSDPTWQRTLIFTVRQDPTERQLHVIPPRSSSIPNCHRSSMAGHRN